MHRLRSGFRVRVRARVRIRVLIDPKLQAVQYAEAYNAAEHCLLQA